MRATTKDVICNALRSRLKYRRGTDGEAFVEYSDYDLSWRLLLVCDRRRIEGKFYELTNEAVAKEIDRMIDDGWPLELLPSQAGSGVVTPAVRAVDSPWATPRRGDLTI